MFLFNDQIVLNNNEIFQINNEILEMNGEIAYRFDRKSEMYAARV